jgi:Rps23 Pro-64 3,4-dihydroxylase Tpa1-like proline 4-hydroxylase
MKSEALADLREDPFPHTSTACLVSNELAEEALNWMETVAPWRLRVESFYEQWELHLNEDVLPKGLRSLIEPETVNQLARRMLSPLSSHELELAEVAAHKLIAGQTIRVHNDFLGDAESHRLLLQLNRNWTDACGGLLMLFGSSSADDVRRVVKPLHRSGFAFTISPSSYHAVSTIRGGERFTVVFSFRQQSKN